MAKAKLQNFYKFKKIGDKISGRFLGFGKNSFGVFLIIKTGKSAKKFVSLHTVLRNIVKSNLQKFDIDSDITITKSGKQKNYFLFDVILNGEKLEATSIDLDKNEIKDYFV